MILDHWGNNSVFESACSASTLDNGRTRESRHRSSRPRDAIRLSAWTSAKCWVGGVSRSFKAYNNTYLYETKRQKGGKNNDQTSKKHFFILKVERNVEDVLVLVVSRSNIRGIICRNSRYGWRRSEKTRKDSSAYNMDSTYRRPNIDQRVLNRTVVSKAHIDSSAGVESFGWTSGTLPVYTATGLVSVHPIVSPPLLY